MQDFTGNKGLWVDEFGFHTRYSIYSRTDYRIRSSIERYRAYKDMLELADQKSAWGIRRLFLFSFEMDRNPLHVDGMRDSYNKRVFDVKGAMPEAEILRYSW